MKTINHSLIGFAMLALLMVPSRGFGAGKSVIVETTDFDKTSTLGCMTEEAFKDLQTQVHAEERAFSKAIAEAKKDWSADEKHKGKSFPSAAFAPRRATAKGPAYKDDAEAQAKLAKLQEQSARSETHRRDQEALREKEQAKVATSGTHKDHDADRKALEAEALTLLKAKIADVLKADPAKVEPKKADPVKVEPAKVKPGAKPVHVPAHQNR